jgi:hypothetical protein
LPGQFRFELRHRRVGHGVMDFFGGAGLKHLARVKLDEVASCFLDFCNRGAEVEIKAIAQLESYGSLHEADTEQNWQHEYRGLLKYKEPCLVEVLLDSGLHVFESLLVFLDHHPLNDVVTLIKLKLQLFSESQVP